jgi:uncharacterized protein YggE
MDSKPDTIKISVQEREEIHADHADLFVTVKGSSAFAGDEALKKAREVHQLVNELMRLGISSDDIHLQGIFIETGAGTLFKSSSATYRLKIRCGTLELIPGLIDSVAAQKEATLERIAWKYPDDVVRQKLLDLAVSHAKIKAEKTAASLGVKLLGVYDFIETYLDEEAPLPYLQAQPAVRSSGFTNLASPTLGMDIHHAKNVQLSIDIWFRVSAF